MSLYQTVRPDDLDEITGNSIVVGGLRNILRKPADSRPHTILLRGPSGCGKTTIARILANEFGSNEDSVFELNAANTNGVDTVRELDKTAHLLGLGGHAKTYIIDESHELSGRAQECFLKIIEDNPPHCYFIFCTTDPEKLIRTIRNRCTEYEVGLLQENEIIEVLKRACQREDLNVSSDIIEAIAYTCDGSPRAALVSLEQVAGITDIDEALELIVSGTERDATVLDLLKLMVMSPEVRRKKWKRIITTFDAIDEDSERIRRSILTFLYNKLKKYDTVEDALDITHLLKIFSTNTYYGGKSQLGALVARACFETWKS